MYNDNKKSPRYVVTESEEKTFTFLVLFLKKQYLDHDFHGRIWL